MCTTRAARRSGPPVGSAGEGADVGADEGTPVTEDYTAPFKFTGTIDKVTIELKEMKAADNEKAEKSHKEAALKKALSDQHSIGMRKGQRSKR